MNPVLDLTTTHGAFLRTRRRTRTWLARARAFRQSVIDPIAAEVDRRALADPTYHPAEVVQAGCRYGLLALPIPRFLGGGDGSVLDAAVVLEELCAGCAGLANIFGAHYLGLSGILLSLDFYHFDQSMREVATAEGQGHPVLFAAAITEPGAGTDVEDAHLLAQAQLTTVARRVQGGYVLDGRKVFISNGRHAQYVTVICAVDRQRPVESWSAFVVRAGTPGFAATRIEAKMGQRACHAAELTFENCFIPTENRVGVEGAAVFATALVLACSRGPVGAIATGIARAAYERTVAYCQRRRSARGTLLDRQWVRLALADMAADVQRSRGAYLQAASFFDERILDPLFGRRPIANSILQAFSPLRRSATGRRLMASDTFKRQTYRWVRARTAHALSSALGISSMAKFSCADAAVRCCTRALEILGPDGGDEAYGIAKLLRDAKLTQIYEGTNQLNRLAFGQALFGEESPC